MSLYSDTMLKMANRIGQPQETTTTVTPPKPGIDPWMIAMAISALGQALSKPKVGDASGSALPFMPTGAGADAMMNIPGAIPDYASTPGGSGFTLPTLGYESALNLSGNQNANWPGSAFSLTPASIPRSQMDNVVNGTTKQWTVADLLKMLGLGTGM